jgi:hypothetical protein
MRLLYDSRELLGVTTTRLGVAGVLQMISESTLTISRACAGRLIRIR